MFLVIATFSQFWFLRKPESTNEFKSEIRLTRASTSASNQKLGKHMLVSSVADPWHFDTRYGSRSGPLTNGSWFRSGSGSCNFRQWPSRRQVFCLLLIEATFSSFFKDKKSWRSRKTVGIMVFSYYFSLMREGSGSVPVPPNNVFGSGSSRPTHTDLDPQHCCYQKRDLQTPSFL